MKRVLYSCGCWRKNDGAFNEELHHGQRVPRAMICARGGAFTVLYIAVVFQASALAQLFVQLGELSWSLQFTCEQSSFEILNGGKLFRNPGPCGAGCGVRLRSLLLERGTSTRRRRKHFPTRRNISHPGLTIATQSSRSTAVHPRITTASYSTKLSDTVDRTHNPDQR